jgi:DNA-binding protein H-NS
MPRLNLNALKTKIAALQKQLTAVENSRAPAIKEVRALMKKSGVTIADLQGEIPSDTGKRRGRPPKLPKAKAPRKANGTRRKVAIKYRDDKGNTWTGRGKTPRWLTATEKAGKSREQFKV